MDGVDYVVHAAAALGLGSAEEIVSVNGEGTRLVLECCASAGVKRLLYMSSAAIYGIPKRHPIYEDAPLDPIGPYGIAKAEAERHCIQARGVETIRIRPRSFVGNGRLGIFQILFDWIECGKRIYVLGDGTNVFQLLEVRDLVEAVYMAALRGHNGEVYNIGAAEYGTVNADLGALLHHAGTGSRIAHIPSTPAKAALAFLERLHFSPLDRWIYETADQDFFVSIVKAREELGYAPKFSNQAALIGTYDWYLREGKQMAQQIGTGNRMAWKQGALKLLKMVS
jgi:nucleoside-diphosphate-sugar epimerase